MRIRTSAYSSLAIKNYEPYIASLKGIWVTTMHSKKNMKYCILFSVAYPAPHQREKLDPDPQQFAGYKPKCMKYENNNIIKS